MKKLTTHRRPRNIGIGRRAKKLGVSVVHLSLVLKGERKSDDLLARYHALVAAETAAEELRAEHDLIESTLAKAAELLAKTDEEEHAFSLPAIHAELAALVSPALRDAVAAVGAHLPVRTMVRFNELFTREQIDFIFRINRTGNRVRLGSVATAPES